MKRKIGKIITASLGLLASSIAFASEGSGATGGSGLVAISSGLAIGLATLGGTLGQGKAAGSALEGIARNPSSRDQVFIPLVLALALIEFQAIMGFLIALFWYIK